MKRLCSNPLSRPRVVFSGIQPTGIPHLGNYVGALRQWNQLQHQEPESTKFLFSIVDLHALTSFVDPKKLRTQKRATIAALLAVGVDPERCTIFHQSSVSAHSELMWILACTSSVGYLSRMTQWKHKLSLAPNSGLQDRSISSKLKLGLFSYPVLQAADILVHRATHVPVGHDQLQHLEFARECVTNFNHIYGPVLVSPETLLCPSRKVMSLTEPTSKMSKSHLSERSRILITDTSDAIKVKIVSALTDSLPGITYDHVNRPGVSNLLDLLSIFHKIKDGYQLADVCKDMSIRELKEMVAETLIIGLHEIRSRYFDLIEQKSYLDSVEMEGTRKAQQSAEETMQLIRSAIGL